MKPRSAGLVILFGLAASCEGPEVDVQVSPTEARQRLEAEMARSEEREIARAKRLYADLTARGAVALDEPYLAENPGLADPKDAREAGEAVKLLQWLQANMDFVANMEWYWSEGQIATKQGVVYDSGKGSRVFRLKPDGTVEVAVNPDGVFAPFGTFSLLVRYPFTLVISPDEPGSHEWRLSTSHPSTRIDWTVEGVAPNFTLMARTDRVLELAFTEKEIVDWVTGFMAEDPPPSLEEVRTYERRLRSSYGRWLSMKQSGYDVMSTYVEGTTYTHWQAVRLPSGLRTAPPRDTTASR